VLILPPGHAQAARARRSFSVREKWILGGVGAVAVALMVAVVVSLTTGGHSTGNGCVDVTFQSSLGAQEFYKCGSAARSLCSSVGAPGGLTGVAGQAAATECRKIGLPVGS
jgi:hypothetical protein